MRVGRRVAGELYAMGQGDAALDEAGEPGAVVQAVRRTGRRRSELASASRTGALRIEQHGGYLDRLLKRPHCRFGRHPSRNASAAQYIGPLPSPRVSP